MLKEQKAKRLFQTYFLFSMNCHWIHAMRQNIEQTHATNLVKYYKCSTGKKLKGDKVHWQISRLHVGLFWKFLINFGNDTLPARRSMSPSTQIILDLPPAVTMVIHSAHTNNNQWRTEDFQESGNQSIIR